MGSGKPQMDGYWPDVDIVVVKDYHQSAAGTPTRTKPDCSLRLHMDIPELDETLADEIGKHLHAGNHEEVYKIVMKHKPIGSDVKGAKALRAALDLDDNGKPIKH